MKSKNKSGILLIDSIFGSPINPYISIPTLAAYLKSRHIPVHVLDLNREFWRQFLTWERVKTGKEHANTRFRQLNSQTRLSFSQMMEYRVLYHTQKEIKRLEHHLNILITEKWNFEDIAKTDFFETCCYLTTLPYYPDFVIFTPAYNMGKQHSSFDIFSSRDIIASTQQDFFYKPLIQDILEKAIETHQPLITGISVVYDDQVLPAFMAAGIVKSKFPRIHVTMGGPFISLHMRNLNDTYLFRCVDSFILDEGEIPLEILYQLYKKHLETGTQSEIDLESVPGLVYVSGEEQVKSTPTAPSLLLEEIPEVDYRDYRLESILKPVEETRFIFRFSRGCRWGRCTFCRTGMYWCRDYSQSPADILYERLHRFISATGAKQFFFSDEISDPIILEYICKRLLQDQIEINWWAQSKVSQHLTRERCQLYRDAGCQQLNLGVESFQDRILKQMNKGISVDLIQKVLKVIDGVVPVSLNMIVGFPSETQDEAMAGFKILKSLFADGLIIESYYSPFQITYASEIWRNPERFGIQNIRLKPGQDLYPNCTDFDCQGMTRKQAYGYSYRFNSSWAQQPPEQENEPTNFNMSLIEMCLDRVHYKINELPYGQWLDYGDSKIQPLNPGEDILLRILKNHVEEKNGTT